MTCCRLAKSYSVPRSFKYLRTLPALITNMIPSPKSTTPTNAKTPREGENAPQRVKNKNRAESEQNSTDELHANHAVQSS